MQNDHPPRRPQQSANVFQSLRLVAKVRERIEAKDDVEEIKFYHLSANIHETKFDGQSALLSHLEHGRREVRSHHLPGMNYFGDPAGDAPCPAPQLQHTLARGKSDPMLEIAQARTSSINIVAVTIPVRSEAIEERDAGVSFGEGGADHTIFLLRNI